MIAHLPLASHPNPKKVLVIGGGDGGVVREVLKHDTVEQVVLCDIDEVNQYRGIVALRRAHRFLQAVIRVSKIYLPHMSSLLADSRVTVHIGDGFKFLSDNKGTYDVIITDSSDPVGPAESLFKKPYFQLLHDALTPGGHISTQGECLWLHLELIQDLMKFTGEIFSTTEYAFTTIPTYPSGQIGFMLCAKAPGRNMRTPVREVKDCRYYNEDVHRAAFVLPEFAKVLLEDNKDIRPKFGRSAKAVEAEASGSSKKKILLLGSGFVARPCAEYIVRNPTNELTIGELSYIVITPNDWKI